MKIAWIVEARHAAHVDHGMASDLASYRYRVAIPARALQAAGQDCRCIGLPEPGAALHQAMEQVRRADVVIFAKNHANLDGVIALLVHAKAAGVATIVDICDDFFEADSPFLKHYRNLVDRAHVVVASCDHLASVIAAATQVVPTVVSDPYEGPRGPPLWNPRTQGVKALWFGSQGNLHSLMREIDALPRKIQGFRLDLLVLSKGLPGIENAFKKFNAQFRNKMTVRFLEWSLQRNWEELNQCDMVLIPVNRTMRFFMAKGPNRLVESLWGGRFVVANSIPSYDEFSQWAWIGDELVEGISWALNHPQKVLEQIHEGQHYIETRHAPAVVAQEWQNACLHAMASAKRAEA